MTLDDLDGAVRRPTLANWRMPPGNRWAFWHVPEIVPSARIRRSGDVTPLTADHDPAIADIAFVDNDGRQRAIGSWLQDSAADAFVVLDGDTLRHEWYSGSDGGDWHILFSVSKSITGLMAGIAAGEGMLDLDDAVADYIPEVAGTTYEGATVRHLLDMTIGTAWDEDYAGGADVAAYRYAMNWTQRTGSEPDLNEFLLGIAPDGAHGERFHYVSPNTDMVGWVLERAAREPFPSLMSRLLWAPLGAEADAMVTVDRVGSPRTAGGICVVPRDLARLGRLVGRGGGGIVPSGFVRDLMFGGDPGQWSAGDYAGFLPDAAYRSFWYRPDHRAVQLAGIGIHGQFIYVDPERDIVVVTLSSWPVAGDDGGDLTTLAASRAVVAALSSARA
jgi:CubicO group peptidase (beta-lactamase class C family)